MLLYSNRSILRQVLELKGTVVYRPEIVLLGLLEAAVCLGLQFLAESDSDWAPKIPNSYALNAMGVVVAFATVFRTQLGWQRYWEALSQVHTMYSKWGDVFTQYSVFARTTIEIMRSKDCSKETEAQIQKILAIYNNVHKHFSLLSALAVDRLAHGDVERMNRRLLVAGWRDRVTTRKELSHQDLTNSRKLPVFQAGGLSTPNLNLDAEEQDSAWTAGDGWTHCYTVEEVPSSAEKTALTDAHDRCNMVLTWILSGLAMTSGDLHIAPPIQSRMYQEVSNGMIAFLDTVKIADVPFPFPLAQVLNVLVIFFACFIPVWVANFTQSLIAGPIISFMLFQSFWCINEVAKDLENPFGTDINDIPLYDFHTRFCRGMKETHRALNVVHGGKVDGINDDDVQLNLDTPGDYQAFSPDCALVIPEGAETAPPALAAAAAAPTVMTAAASLTKEALPTTPATALVATPAAAPPLRPIEDGSTTASSGPKEAHAEVEVIDRQLAQIGLQMEQHLAQIARDLDNLTAKVAGSPLATPSTLSPAGATSRGNAYGGPAPSGSLIGCLGGLGRTRGGSGPGSFASGWCSTGPENA